MHLPYGFAPTYHCTSCQWRRSGSICDLSAETLEKLELATFTTVYPGGALLYGEGQSPRGAFLICRGRVKLYLTSADGKSIITHVAHEGELLAASNLITNSPHGTTAETLEPTQINFIDKTAFLELIARDGELSLRVAEQLSHDCQIAEGHVRSLGLSTSAREKLAHLLLTWLGERDDGTRIPLLVTHLEIAQMIGTSRETTTRLLGELKGDGVISIKASTLIINDRNSLEAMVHI